MGEERKFEKNYQSITQIFLSFAISNFLSLLSSPRTISVKYTEQIIWIEHVLFGSNRLMLYCSYGFSAGLL